MSYFKHESAYIDEPSSIGEGVKVWHFCHVASGAVIGAGSMLGQNVYVAPGVVIGKNCRIQNNVSLFTGVELEDDVFCGPSCVFTNVNNPRAQIVRRPRFVRTVVRRGASIGANATIVCGSVIGRYAFIAAGAVLKRQVVPDYALMMGVPARRVGWMSRHGRRLTESTPGRYRCPESGFLYEESAIDALSCIDLDEDEPLPMAAPASDRSP